eukprot:TRINITY_DN49039_c0_g1_i1.p1 TRINITY_DN49039_c0_g1~~TRINITY_DN49039_c0_g1_i1.p1  ORF type:complete len:198 (-),score=23.33 TRINITY_DN49039_c0_g1_i1:342-935(-)
MASQSCSQRCESDDESGSLLHAHNIGKTRGEDDLLGMAKRLSAATRSGTDNSELLHMARKVSKAATNKDRGFPSAASPEQSHKRICTTFAFCGVCMLLFVFIFNGTQVWYITTTSTIPPVSTTSVLGFSVAGLGSDSSMSKGSSSDVIAKHSSAKASGSGGKPLLRQCKSHCSKVKDKAKQCKDMKCSGCPACVKQP